MARRAAHVTQMQACCFAGWASIRFLVGPGADFAVGGDFDPNGIRMAAHRAIFSVLLAFSLREIDRHDDLFTARGADVAGFVLHGFLRDVKF